MHDLHAVVGPGARDALVAAFDTAQRSIDAAFYSIDDRSVIESLRRASRRHVEVRIHVEGDPHRFDAARKALTDPSDGHLRFISENGSAELHAKVAVIDGERAFVSTANAAPSGFSQPGEALIEDDRADDVRAIQDAIAGRTASSPRVVCGPSHEARERITALLGSQRDIDVAAEDLSDPRIVAALLRRRADGHRDRILVNRGMSNYSRRELRELVESGIELRACRSHAYMHDKFIDAGDRLYVGSANLTRNGLDEAREVGIVADAADFDDGGKDLRAQFDQMWGAGRALTRRELGE